MDQQPKQTSLTSVLSLPTKATHILPHPSQPQSLISTTSAIHILDLPTLSLSHTLPLSHPRLTAMQTSPTLLLTAGTDSKVCLYDMRTYENVHTFNKQPSKFESLDMSEHIVVGGTGSNLVFWDLRKMKQRAQFKDSFNDDVVCVRFQDMVKTNLYACSVDGMINMFSLTQPNQQQSFQWCHKLLESPLSLTPGNTNTLLTHTSQHTLYKIHECDLIGKITPNNLSNPKHILHSTFSYNTNNEQYQYYCWNQNQAYIEKWVGGFMDKSNQEKCVGGIWDTGAVVEVFGLGDKAGISGVFGDDTGKIYVQKFQGKSKRKNSDHGHQKNNESQNMEIIGQKWKFSKKGQQKQQGNKTITKNGYVLQKPVSSFAKHKNFKPY